MLNVQTNSTKPPRAQVATISENETNCINEKNSPGSELCHVLCCYDLVVPYQRLQRQSIAWVGEVVKITSACVLKTTPLCTLRHRPVLCLFKLYSSGWLV
jgi:hypothetical protein